MPGLNSQGTCENAEVAIAASAAAAIMLLNKVVTGRSSKLTWTPANRALTHQMPNDRSLEMPLHNRFDSCRASLWTAIARGYRLESECAFHITGLRVHAVS